MIKIEVALCFIFFVLYVSTGVYIAGLEMGPKSKYYTPPSKTVYAVCGLSLIGFSVCTVLLILGK